MDACRQSSSWLSAGRSVARNDSGGHVGALHVNGRPTGHHTPSEGYVDETTGYFNATYYASEIGGVVDSTIHCTTGWINCLDGTVPFGVGLQTLEDLGEGVGYTLTGDRAPHPSNHWGVPAFLAGARNVARLFADDYPDLASDRSPGLPQCRARRCGAWELSTQKEKRRFIASFLLLTMRWQYLKCRRIRAVCIPWVFPYSRARLRALRASRPGCRNASSSSWSRSRARANRHSGHRWRPGCSSLPH